MTQADECTGWSPSSVDVRPSRSSAGTSSTALAVLFCFVFFFVFLPDLQTSNNRKTHFICNFSYNYAVSRFLMALFLDPDPFY